VGRQTRAALAEFRAVSGRRGGQRVTPALLDELERVQPIAALAGPGIAGPLIPAAAELEPKLGPGETRPLRPGDRITIRIEGAEPKVIAAEIDPQGRLVWEPGHAMQAAGLLPADVEKEIAVRLLDDYLRRLSVRLVRETEAAKERIDR
jgi:hypothetical protein